MPDPQPDHFCYFSDLQIGKCYKRELSAFPPDARAIYKKKDDHSAVIVKWVEGAALDCKGITILTAPDEQIRVCEEPK